jgi:hypothetical protein
MAPKTAMKVMKVMKKPAAAGCGGGDSEPDKKPKETDVLTEAALAKLENASDDKVETFLNKLGDKDQQRLWKRFESNRKMENTDDDYKAIASGSGKILAIALLHLY